MAALTLLWALGSSLWSAGPVGLERTEAMVGLHAADYSTVGAGAAGVWTGQASFVGRHGPWCSQVDLASGRVAESWIGLAGAQVSLRDGAGATGVGWVRTQLEDGIHSDAIRLQRDVWSDSEVVVALDAGREFKSFGEDLWFLECMIAFFPGDRSQVVAGFSYAPTRIKQTRADLQLRLEHDVLRLHDASASVYAQWGGNVLARLAGGVVVHWNALSPCARHLDGARSLFRFK